MHLLLLGIRKYEFPPNGVSDCILLDGWLEIKIDPQVFDCVFTIKAELENMLTRVCHQPAQLMSLSHIENQILDTIKKMCAFDSIEVVSMVNTSKPPLFN